jgi:hypothetical protein
MLVYSDKSNANIQLAHNYYMKATLYFNPTANYIYLDSEDVKDIYIYYARLDFKDKDESKIKENVPSLTVNIESLNSNNFNLNTKDSQGEMQLCANSGDNQVAAIDNNMYPYYWRKPIVPGMEYPAGQKVSLTIDAAGYVMDADSWVTVENDNVYLLDYIHVLIDATEMTYQGYKIDVSDIYYRVYGRDKTGSKVQVYDATQGKFVDDDANGSIGWTRMNRGSKEANSSTFNAYDMEISGWQDDTAGTLWSTYSKTAENVTMISPINATKFIQYRIKGKAVEKRNSRSNVRATEGSTVSLQDEIDNYIPDYFCTDAMPEQGEMSDDEYAVAYMYVLNGQNKIVTLASGIETGIEDLFEAGEAEDDVEGAEVETIYYNLQGQRVNNPDRGIYIRVRGNRADKVAL